MKHAHYFCFAQLLLLSSTASGFLPSTSRSGFGVVRSPLQLIGGRISSLPYAASPSAASSRDETTGSSSSSSSSDGIQVFDNVFHPAICEVIRALSVEGTLRRDSEGTVLFVRPPFNTTALTPIEHAMDSALATLGDTSRVVEYWSRDEYMNIDAHVDIDEVDLEEEGRLRAPKMAHVLYLRMKEELRGECPTCVFPSQLVGWDSGEVDVDLVTVPAVQGRLLRFPGSAMHAVPCPANRWLLTDDEEIRLRQEEEEDCDADDDDEGEDDYDDEEDDDDDDDEYIERAVLLFNTWSDDEPPPRDVPKDYESQYHTEAQRVAEWTADYGVDAELLRCHPTSMWREVVVTNADRENEASVLNSSAKRSARIKLMGEEHRRLSRGENARLSFTGEHIEEMLHQDTVPTLLRLRQDS